MSFPLTAITINISELMNVASYRLLSQQELSIYYIQLSILLSAIYQLSQNRLIQRRRALEDAIKRRLHELFFLLISQGNIS